MAKLTKVEMINNLKGFLAEATVEAKEVINYVVEQFNSNPRNVTLGDLSETLEIVKAMVVPQPQLLPVENSIKKPIKKAERNEDDVLLELEQSIEEEEHILGTADNKEEKKQKLSVVKNEKPKEEKKPETKKETPKKEPVVKSTSKVISLPDTYDSEIGTLKARKDIKSIKDINELKQSGLQLVVCAYWTKRDLRQYNYDPMRVNQKPIDSFTDDLDIQIIPYASENGTVFTSISLYTEVPFIYTPHGFESDEDGLRYMNGVEYQIYELVE